MGEIIVVCVSDWVVERERRATPGMGNVCDVSTDNAIAWCCAGRVGFGASMRMVVGSISVLPQQPKHAVYAGAVIKESIEIIQ